MSGIESSVISIRNLCNKVVMCKQQQSARCFDKYAEGEKKDVVLSDLGVKRREVTGEGVKV